MNRARCVPVVNTVKFGCESDRCLADSEAFELLGQGVLHVLVVDDDPNQGRSLAIGLRLEGFQVTTICDGEAALALVDASDFDAAIVDLMLPGVNGIELARQMRNRRPNTRVLLTSAYHLSENQIRRADCGVVGFIPKPFELTELADFLRAKISGPPESVRKAAGVR